MLRANAPTLRLHDTKTHSFSTGFPAAHPSMGPIIGAAVGVVSQWGDLFESKLKRISHVKDAGGIIPGHGGMLDRLDSVVVSVPVVYYFVAMVLEP